MAAKSNLLVVGAALSAGLAGGYYAGKTSKAPEEISATPTSSQNLDRLQAFAAADLENYFRLKTNEEKFKKADELLAKMVTILMADLGLRMSNGAIVTVAPAPPSVNANDGTKPTASRVAPFKKEIGSPSGHTLSIEDVRTPSEIEEFLKSADPKSFNEQIANAPGFSNKNGVLANYDGRFAGTARVTYDEKPMTWELALTFHGKMVDRRLQGQYRLTMASSGKEFSNGSSNGALDGNVRELPYDPLAVVIEASPDTVLQTYYVKRTDSIIANIMRRPKNGATYAIIGIVELRRQ